MREDLEALARASGGTLRIRAPEPPEAWDFSPSLRERPALRARTFQGRIDRSWTIASFSSLTSSHRYAGETADTDAAPDPEESRGVAAEADLTGEAAREGFLAFPRGTRAGICLHAIFENLDFTKAFPSVLSEPVRTHLQDFGFDSSWEPEVCRMVRDVLSNPLDRDRTGLRLERVPMTDRLNEVAFFFPLNRITPEALGGLFLLHAEKGIGGPPVGADRTASVRSGTGVHEGLRGPGLPA